MQTVLIGGVLKILCRKPSMASVLLVRHAWYRVFKMDGPYAVTKLTEDVKHTGRRIAQGNSFTSLRLEKNLLVNGLLSVETVRLEKEDLPQMLKANDTLEICGSMFLTKEGVAARK
ncbi:piggyBac transposable element-derived protein 4 [Trichonephila clavipes]|nr:piggyBac transposable element-derived protein 4 [Trichonephila clavipes]